MKKWLWGCVGLTVCFLWGCHKTTPDEKVKAAAVMYYDYLVKGQYDSYIDGIAYRDSMTEEYRNQMVDLAAQYAAREKELRGGLVAVRALSDTIMNDVALVFLEVQFGDSTREEISLPMVLCGEEWKMQ